MAVPGFCTAIPPATLARRAAAAEGAFAVDVTVEVAADAVDAALAVGGSASGLYPLVRGMYNDRKDTIDAFGWNNKLKFESGLSLTADVNYSKATRNEISLVNLETAEHIPMVVGFNPKSVKWTADGNAALALLRTTGVDLVVVDMAMPGLSDVNLITRIRSYHPGVRIAVLTLNAATGHINGIDADVTLVPSRWPEPFGMTGLESMRCGRPVVAANHGGIPEWLGEGCGGALFTPGSPEALARAVERVLSQPDAGERARAHVARQFGGDVAVNGVEALLREVVAVGVQVAPARPRSTLARLASALGG